MPADQANMDLPNTDLQPGFSDPVTQAQQCFRHILKAMSEPGLIRQIKAGMNTLGKIDAASFAVLQTLVDNDTLLWLAPAFNQSRIRKNLSFHCGCPVIDSPEQAHFLLATGSEELNPEQCSPGNAVRPDDAATVLLQVDSIRHEFPSGGCGLTLKGPGIPGQRQLFVSGLGQHWQDWLQVRHQHFPLGMDLILCAGDSLCALPRAVQVAIMTEKEVA
ncbi:MAG: phosphonate C-P lyase system protein PhnH [Endozoicomonas sp.]